ncbi:hypothetical protein LOD99_8695 [Oopsacas minuta]|uniref:Lysosomal dipeptide transporter MFSD1 n=1 Tax=Oopsacas minuta TaxID=111878 RepID=A0AAV7JGR3_9METZ|nr:hypothetical protein LOD99_8695 [Oopsacas minuta]
MKFKDIRDKLSSLKTVNNYFTVSAFILITLLNFGPGFSYDNPAALEQEILRTLKISNAEYEILYITTSWPNVLFPIIGGYLLDRVIGYRLGTIIYTSCVLFGQALFILGCGFNMFWLMCVGRFFFGIGTENTTVAQFTYAGRWFKGAQISIVFGVIFTFTRLGSILDFNVTQALYFAILHRFQLNSNICLSLAYTLGFCLCTLSLIFAIILAVVDKKAEKYGTFNEKIDEKRTFRLSLKNFAFPFNMWLIFIIIICAYLVFPFITLAPVFFQTKYGYSSALSSFTVSIFFITVTIVSSINGLIIDRTGKHLIWILIANVLVIVSHSIFAFTFLPPVLPAIILGIGYSLATTAVWALPTYILSVNQLGTAYGCSLSALNLGEGIISVLSGVIVDNYGYLSLEVFFIFLNLIWLFWSIILFCSDYAKGGVLNKWGRSRRNKKDKEEKIESPISFIDAPLLESEEPKFAQLELENSETQSI